MTFMQNHWRLHPASGPVTSATSLEIGTYPSPTANVASYIREENLKPEETQAFMESAFRDGAISTVGTAITAILPAVSRFSPDGFHGELKANVIQKLSDFFERFFGLGMGSND